MKHNAGYQMLRLQPQLLLLIVCVPSAAVTAATATTDCTEPMTSTRLHRRRTADSSDSTR